MLIEKGSDTYIQWQKAKRALAFVSSKINKGNSMTHEVVDNLEKEMSKLITLLNIELALVQRRSKKEQEKQFNLGEE